MPDHIHRPLSHQIRDAIEDGPLLRVPRGWLAHPDHAR
jgi:hypothetical protein